MAPKPIDPYAAVTYGNFAASQIMAHVESVEAEFAATLRHAAQRLIEATDGMAAALKHANEAAVGRPSLAPRQSDPLAVARDVLERLASYAGSRTEGRALAARVLGARSASSLKSARPAEMLATLDHALRAVMAERDKLPEHTSWLNELSAARGALAAFDPSKVPARAPQGPSAAVTAVHAEWLRTYAAVRLIVEGVLRLHSVDVPMSEIFAELAERRYAED